VSLKPSLTGIAKGFVPSLGTSGEMLPVLGLVGTTFVITAAFYQAYLVRQKGWKKEDLKSGLVDARVGSVIMFLITLMLMSTAAAAFYIPGGPKVELKNPVAVATALEETFGASAKIIFCLGLFSAAYSSFLVNSMIGGFMASDGLGLGSKPTDNGPRLMTTAALLTGMFVGVAVLIFDFDRTPTIIFAQAMTVVAAPLVAGVLLWLTSSRDIMGEHVNGPGTIAFAGLGLVMLIAMAAKTAFELPEKVDSYLHPPAATAVSDDQTTPFNSTVSVAGVSQVLQAQN
ncbi:MAG: divalent metal cation transporter, partial [Fuerstiella sp.]